MKERVVAPQEWHPQHCDCAVCEPYAPSLPRFWRAANAIACQVLAGVTFGTGVCWVLDAVVHGPGVFALFGWGR